LEAISGATVILPSISPLGAVMMSLDKIFHANTPFDRPLNGNEIRLEFVSDWLE
jgi:hypothetical protein